MTLSSPSRSDCYLRWDGEWPALTSARPREMRAASAPLIMLFRPGRSSDPHQSISLCSGRSEQRALNDFCQFAPDFESADRVDGIGKAARTLFLSFWCMAELWPREMRPMVRFPLMLAPTPCFSVSPTLSPLHLALDRFKAIDLSFDQIGARHRYRVRSPQQMMPARRPGI